MNRDAQATPSPRMLRRRAEAYLRQSDQEIARMPVADVQQLIYELQVHQVELELQNEELRTVQQELAVSLDRYADLYDFAPIGYVTLNQAGEIVAANLMAAALLGVERSGLIHTPLMRFVALEEREAFLRHHQQALLSTMKQRAELRFHKANGTDCYLCLESLATPTKAEVERFCRVALLDITERVQAEAALRQARDDLERQVETRTEELQRAEHFALLGQLVSSVSHEIRNPLNIIALHLDLLEEDLPQASLAGNTTDIAEALETMREAVDRLTDIVHNYLSLSRGEGVQLTPTELGAFLNDFAAELRQHHQADHVTLTIADCDTMGYVLLHPTSFRRALFNLVQNAYDAMPQGGAVTLQCQRQGAQVCLQIQDTGCGIAEAQLDALFTPLFTTKPGGTGLGLHVVREIVKAHQGTINVQSAVGHGTTFSITLPLVAPPDL